MPIRAPPKAFLRELKQIQKSENVKYTEYRMNLIKFFAKKSKIKSESKETFINKIMSSNDLKKLLFDSSFINSIDHVGGIPKIAMTLLSIYLENEI